MIQVVRPLLLFIVAVAIFCSVVNICDLQPHPVEGDTQLGRPSATWQKGICVYSDGFGVLCSLLLQKIPTPDPMVTAVHVNTYPHKAGGESGCQSNPGQLGSLRPKVIPYNVKVFRIYILVKMQSVYSMGISQ